jgi:hypothetical protein
MSSGETIDALERQGEADRHTQQQQAQARPAMRKRRE